MHDFFSSNLYLEYYKSLPGFSTIKLDKGFVVCHQKLGVKSIRIFSDDFQSVDKFLDNNHFILWKDIQVNTLFSYLDHPVSQLNNYLLDSYIVNLSSFTLDLVSENHRRNIKKAVKAKIEVTKCSDIESMTLFMSLWQQTYLRKTGKCPNGEYLFSLLSINQLAPKTVEVYLAFDGSNLLSGALVIKYEDTVYYLHGGTRDLSLGSSHLVHLTIIQDAINNGYQFYHMGSGMQLESKLKDIQNINEFKRRWGAQIISKYYFASKESLLGRIYQKVMCHEGR
jgi:hypothetical protein